MSIYYNEFDPKCCAWLRELAKERLIPDGTIDARDIRDVQPGDCGDTSHFFAGIGGWPLALCLAGWPDDWPVWTGSCPCQPLSCAGKRKGEKDQRHLWPEFYRLISECRPGVVFGEQVGSRDGLEWLDGISLDLEELGYAVGASDLPAAGVGAPHIRQRLYWVAESRSAKLRRWPEPERKHRGALHATDRSDTFRVADAESVRTRAGITGQQGGAGLAGRSSECRDDGTQRPAAERADGELDRLGNASGRGCRVVGNAAHPGDSGHAECSSWSRFDIVPCRDGKARRFEPGSFPLADGLPGRVGLLRGYGNAIVPQVAARFVRAFMDVLAEQSL